MIVLKGEIMMFEAHEHKKAKRIVGDTEIETQTVELTSANILEIEVGTNGYCGGDTGHGSRTYFRLKDLASTDMEIKIITGDYGDDGVEIILGGDTELSTFIGALEFAAKVLKEQSKE